MARILGVDFGERRIGLATSDASGRIATPRRTLLRKNDASAADFLLRFCTEEEIEFVVFGIPKSPDGDESEFAARIRSFVIIEACVPPDDQSPVSRKYIKASARRGGRAAA